MERDFKLYLFDIIEAIKKIQAYTSGITRNDFLESNLTQDAVIRRLEIIGEAVKHLPDSIKQDYPKIDWRKAAGMRDVVAHDYFGVDFNVTWDTIEQDLPLFQEQVTEIFNKLSTK